MSFLKGKPQGRGFNSTTVHGGLARDFGYEGGIHAEVASLKNVDKADTIFVIRIRRADNCLSMSAPCNKCRKYMKDKGIKKVIYSNWQGSFETVRL